MSDDEDEKVPELKVVLLGESGVGKSSIIKRFVSHTFDPDLISSISSKVTSHDVEVKGTDKKIRFNLWDTAGQEKYRSTAKIFYKDAKIIILVYNIINKESFEALREYWYGEVNTNVISKVIYAVVGNKCDLYNDSQVPSAEAEQWADSINAIFQLTSAKTNSGVDLLFENLAKKYFDPDFNYKKGDEEDKKNYEQKKIEQEENKKKEKEKENEVEVEEAVNVPQVHNITLEPKDIKKHHHKKKKCC